jgi:glycosyltransferase involved in cell wall biosynthesis
MLLDDVDAVIIPSLVWEAFSIVAREAMACGVPVIASRLGALPEAIRDGENGLLFTPNGASELGSMLQLLQEDPSRLGHLRVGIRRDDWISSREHAARLERLLERVRREGVRERASAWGFEQLSSARTLLQS